MCSPTGKSNFTRYHKTSLVLLFWICHVINMTTIWIQCMFPPTSPFFGYGYHQGIEGMREYGIETNSQNLRRLHGQSSWNLRQCIRKLLLSNPRRRIQRQPLGQSSANQTSHLLVHRLCFVSPMSLVRLERVLLRVHDTSPHYVPCSLYKLSRDQYFYTYWVVILFTPKNKYGMFSVPRQKVY